MNDLTHSELLEQDSASLHRTMHNSESDQSTGTHPSKEAYGVLIYLYEYFNTRLFHGILPPCMFTMPRGRRGLHGYFLEDSWSHAQLGQTCDEIALNPIHFQHESTENILGTLVHEMVHLRQQHFGTPGKGAYHNKEWARMMREVGLIGSDTGKPGGKEIGRSMSHVIEEGGAFQRVCQELLDTGFVLPWHLLTPSESEDEGNSGNDGSQEDETTRRKRASKTKYTCPTCAINAWAKPKTSLLCGTCHQALLAAAS